MNCRDLLAGFDTCIYTYIMKQLSETDSTDYMAAAGCFCLASRQAARKITRLYDSYMLEAGIRVTQFTILSQLMLRGELPIGKLAGILGMERTTLTRNHHRAGAGCGAPQLSLLVEGAGPYRQAARR